MLKVFVHQIVIFTVEASPPPKAKLGSAVVQCNPLTFIDASQSVEEQAHQLQSIAWKLIYNTRKDRKRQAIKRITRPWKVHTLDDPKGE